MATLDLFPTEIVLRVFQHCDNFCQVAALSSTGRRYRSIWQSQTSTVIWHVGVNSIVHFEDALLAVRATAIVQEHFSRLELPPHPFPLESVKGTISKPSLDELKSVFDVQHLASCVEVFAQRHVDELPENRTSWRNSLHRALYRLLLAGAALASTYHEPFLQSTSNRPVNFLKGYTQELKEPPHQQNFAEVLTTEDFSYLLRFPIYNFESFDKHGAAFDQLAEFFVGASRRRAQDAPLNDAFLSDFLSQFPKSDNLISSEAGVLFTETTQLLAAYELLQKNSAFSDEEPSNSRPAAIVHFGSFFPVTVYPPQEASDIHNRGFSLKPFALEQRPGVPYVGPLDLLLDSVLWESGQPNYYSSMCPVPRPPLQFFHYIYRKYLGMRFSSNAFEESKYSTYDGWIANPAIFSDCFDTWSTDLEGTFVAEADTPRRCYFRE